MPASGHRTQSTNSQANQPRLSFANANEDLNRFGKTNPINMPMGPYGRQRLVGCRSSYTTARASGETRAGASAEAMGAGLTLPSPISCQWQEFRRVQAAAGSESFESYLMSRVPW